MLTPEEQWLFEAIVKKRPQQTLHLTRAYLLLSSSEMSVPVLIKIMEEPIIVGLGIANNEYLPFKQTVSRHPLVTADVLEHLFATNALSHQMRLLIEHPLATDNMFDQIFSNSSLFPYISLALQHPNCPSHCLAEYVETQLKLAQPLQKYMEIVLRHSRLPVSLVQRFLRDVVKPGWQRLLDAERLDTRANVLANPKVPRATLKVLYSKIMAKIDQADHKSKEILCSLQKLILANPNCPQTILNQVKIEPHVGAHAHALATTIISNPNCSAARLRQLFVTDTLRKLVLIHPNCPEDVLMTVLLGHGNSMYPLDVRLSVLNHHELRLKLLLACIFSETPLIVAHALLQPRLPASLRKQALDKALDATLG